MLKLASVASSSLGSRLCTVFSGKQTNEDSNHTDNISEITYFILPTSDMVLRNSEKYKHPCYTLLALTPLNYRYIRKQYRERLLMDKKR
jgi:hypothetical protein